MPSIPPGAGRPNNREQIPPGRYLCAIHVVQKTISKKGTPRVSFHFRILAGPHKGRFLFDDAYLTGNGVWKVQKIGDVVGITDPVDPDDAADLIEKFANRHLFVTWAEDEWRGQVRHKATAYHPVLVQDEADAAPAAASG